MKWIIGFQRQCRHYYVQGAVGDTSAIVSESVNGHSSLLLHFFTYVTILLTFKTTHTHLQRSEHFMDTVISS